MMVENKNLSKYLYGYEFTVGNHVVQFDIKAGELSVHGCEKILKLSPNQRFRMERLCEDAFKNKNNKDQNFVDFSKIYATQNLSNYNNIRSLNGSFKKIFDLLDNLVINNRKEIINNDMPIQENLCYRLNTSTINNVSYSGYIIKKYKSKELRRSSSEKSISELIKILIRAYPKELEGFFFKVGEEYMPFHYMDPNIYGTPQWPIPISNAPSALIPKRKADDRDSLWRQRAITGARLYNGRIYRLLTATKDKWEIARTEYFKILDSCDYLRERILEEWFNVKDRKTPSVKIRWAQDSIIVQEWVRRVQSLRKGDFSEYNAGLAMNMPIFIRKKDGIHLLLAKSALKKAAGGGKMHVVPAGMLEFFRNTEHQELKFEHFITYITKELYEEAFKDPELTEEGMHEMLEGYIPKNNEDQIYKSDDESYENEVGDLLGLEELENLFNQLENRYKENKDREFLLKLSQTVRALKMDTPTYQIVDAFRLRPEIIMPIILDDEGSQIWLGWEYEENSSAYHNLTDPDFLLQNMLGGRTTWAEPGLAGMFFGAMAEYNRLGLKKGFHLE